MSDVFDPTSIYQLLGQTVTHLPADGGEITGLAMLDLHGAAMLGGGIMAVDPMLRYMTGTFTARRGDSFVIGNDVWTVREPQRQITDGAEAYCLLERST